MRSTPISGSGGDRAHAFEERHALEALRPRARESAATVPPIECPTRASRAGATLSMSARDPPRSRGSGSSRPAHPRALTEAAEIRREDIVPGAGQGRRHEIPGRARVEEAVDEQDGEAGRRRLGIAEAMNPELKTVDLVRTGGALHRGDLPGLARPGYRSSHAQSLPGQALTSAAPRRPSGPRRRGTRDRRRGRSWRPCRLYRGGSSPARPCRGACPRRRP